jgi:hypothetical protein
MFNQRVPGGTRFAAGATGTIPLRFEGAPDGPFRGENKWRGVRRIDHGELCRAFGVAEVGFHWDLPSAMRGMGVENRRASERTTIQSGFLFMDGRDSPVAKITVIRDGEKLRDYDPTSRSDFEILSR